VVLLLLIPAILITSFSSRSTSISDMEASSLCRHFCL
jgi:hypothetical protein